MYFLNQDILYLHLNTEDLDHDSNLFFYESRS